MNTVTIFAKKDYVSRDGTVPIYLRLTMDRKVYSPIYLQRRVEPHLWDDHRREVKSAHPSAGKINLLLQRTLQRAQEILLDHEITGRVLSYESFVKEFAGLSPYDFYDVADDYSRVNRGIFSDEYQEKIRHVTNKLREFAPTLELHRVDYDFIKAYHQHLVVVRKNSKNTIHSNLRIVRRIFGEAVKRGLIKRNPFADFKLEKSKTSRESLTLEEVKLYEALLHTGLPHYLRKTLCWFLLAIYSGRRYQDLQDFPNWIFYEDHVRLTQQKRIRGRDERKVILLYLNDKLRSIIQEIRANAYEPLTNAKAGQFLKQINAMVGMEKKITFHCARHTFATINKRLTQDLTVRRDLLGQDSINSTLIYDHTDASLLKEIMLKWNGL